MINHVKSKTQASTSRQTYNSNIEGINNMLSNISNDYESEMFNNL